MSNLIAALIQKYAATKDPVDAINLAEILLQQEAYPEAASKVWVVVHRFDPEEFPSTKVYANKKLAYQVAADLILEVSGQTGARRDSPDFSMRRIAAFVEAIQSLYKTKKYKALINYWERNRFTQDEISISEEPIETSL